jgi:hypothetical protein
VSSAVLSSQGLAMTASIEERGLVFLRNTCQLQCITSQAVFVSPRVYAVLQAGKPMDSLFVRIEGGKVDEESGTLGFSSN